MPDGIQHHPLTGGTPTPPGHTRVCLAGAYRAATRTVLNTWARSDYHDAHGISPAVDEAITQLAWNGCLDGRLCRCTREKSRART